MGDVWSEKRSWQNITSSDKAFCISQEMYPRVFKKCVGVCKEKKFSFSKITIIKDKKLSITACFTHTTCHGKIDKSIYKTIRRGMEEQFISKSRTILYSTNFVRDMDIELY